MTKRLKIEKKVFEKMVLIYCKNNHQKKPPCDNCKEILKYGLGKIENCYYGENKPFCSKCKIHCYKDDMKKKVKEIMRYSGPRIFFYHPLISLKHLISSIF